IPALIFAIGNIGDAYTLKGWAIPTATETAFALAILMMCGKHIPSSLKIFLLSLAIFDDVGASLIIAIFYTTKHSVAAFVVGG
ncbi:Na+/H+ antiporter NhaA, partial [Campylobacter coli]|uniref:Na+/H+ antiporter NhaA n=1 Tax=Campylobacter coli TaxID=195 RepID=UPI0025AED4E9